MSFCKRTSGVLCLLLISNWVTETAQATSVYAITTKINRIVKVYNIDTDQIEYQETVTVTDYGEGVGTVGLAIDSDTHFMFVKNEL